MSTSSFDFSRNTVLRAGAGTGKTETLTALYLRLILGLSGRAQPLRPERIVAVTFTEKAAYEMRSRVIETLSRLKHATLCGELSGKTSSVVQSIWEELQHLQLHSATPIEFDDLAQAVQTAPIQTIHSFCARILRNYAPYAQLEEAFSVLNEFDANRLLDTAFTETVFDELKAKDAFLARWIQSTGGFDTQHDASPKEAMKSIARVILGGEKLFVDILQRDSIRKAALDIFGISQNAAGMDSAAYRAAFSTLLSSHVDLANELREEPRRKRFADNIDNVVSSHRPLLDASITIDILHKLASALDKACGDGIAKSRQPAARLREAAHALYCDMYERPLSVHIAGVINKAIAKYQALKRAYNVVDYDDLQTLTKALLETRQDVRHEIQSSIDALLIDEFQDTNELQRSLLFFLRTENQPVFIVGDWKQSIYGFRGADVRVFERTVETLLNEGGQELRLRTNYRSHARLVAGLNRLAEVTFTSTDLAHITYHPEHEGLEPAPLVTENAQDSESASRPKIEWLASGTTDDGSAPHEREARNIAQRIEQIVNHEVRDLHNPTYGDFALLLPRFTHLAHYASALESRGIPYTIVGGRGIVHTPEYHDILALMRIIASFEDAQCVVQLLRSPMMMCSDTFLTELSQTPAFHWQQLFAEDYNPPEPLLEALSKIQSLRASIAFTPLSTLVESFLIHSGYRAVLSGLPQSAQRLSVVETILADIRALESEGRLAQTIVRMWMSSSGTTSVSESLNRELTADDSVKLMTIHQSKGLEFPIVIAADLGWNVSLQHPPIVFHPAYGLASVIRDHSNNGMSSQTVRIIREALIRDHVAERRRLFYVQMTRAKRYLILCEPQTKTAYSASSVATTIIAPNLEALISEGHVVRHELSLETQHQTTSQNRKAVANDDLNVDLSRLQEQSGPLLLGPVEHKISATELSDSMLCPRRYYFRHIYRLAEFRHENLSLANHRTDPRLRGIIIHKVVEQLISTADSTLRLNQLVDALEGLDEQEQKEIIARVQPFISGPYIAHIKHTQSRATTELPFIVQHTYGGDTFFISGQVDLLVQHPDGDVDIIDYKVISGNARRDIQAYVPQLAIYRYAMHSIFPRAEVRCGVQYLDGTNTAPTWVHRMQLGSEPEITNDSIQRSCDQLVAIRSKNTKPPRREDTFCKSIRCGFIRHCYPGASRLTTSDGVQ